MEYIVLAFYFLLFLWIIYKSKFFSVVNWKKKYTFLAFALKLSFLVFFYCLTTYHPKYNKDNDSLGYFKDAKKLNDLFYEHPADYLNILVSFNHEDHSIISEFSKWESFGVKTNVLDNQNMIKLNSILAFFSFGNYKVHLLIVVFLSFLGLFAVFKIFSGLYPAKSKLFYIALCMIPSTLFWSSGVLKESFIMLFSGFFCYFLIHYLFYNKKTALVYAFIFFLLTFFIKNYVGLIIFPLFMAMLVIRYFKNRNCWKITAGILLLFFIAGMIVGAIFPKYDFITILSDKRNIFISMCQAQENTSYFPLEKSDGTLWDMLSKVPGGIWNVFTRPHFASNAIFTVYGCAIENVVILLAVIFFCFFIRTKNLFRNPMVVYAFFFFFLNFILIGFSTPNAGALVRYKSIALPYLFIFFILLADEAKIRNKLSQWVHFRARNKKS